LIENHIDFEYIIIGNGREKELEIKENLSKYKEVKFIGYKNNPYPYIKNADYIVQLSDFESWGNTITEGKILGTPAIITSFATAYEQIEDNINGIIIDLKEKDYTKYINRIVNNKNFYKKNLETFDYNNEIEEWNNLLKS